MMKKLINLYKFFSSPKATNVNKNVRVIHLWSPTPRVSAFEWWRVAYEEALKHLKVDSLNFNMWFTAHTNFLSQRDPLALDGWTNLATLERRPIEERSLLPAPFSGPFWPTSPTDYWLAGRTSASAKGC